MSCPRRHLHRRMALLTIALVVTPIVCMHFGAAKVSVAQIAQVMLSHLPSSGMSPPSPIADALIWDNRAPRVLAGLGIGAILAVGGTALQAMTRNPLAEPYVLGVSSGASTGAAASVVLLGVAHGAGLSAMAFLGAGLATVLVLAVGGGRSQGVLHLVLAGLACGFIFQSVTNLIVFSSADPETARSVMFWMLGSLSHSTWDSAWAATLVAVALTVLFWVTAPLLDAVSSGDTTALTVGLDPVRMRVVVTLVVSFAVAVAVAAAGGIGFVGLVVPHLCRHFLARNHRVLVVGAAMSGGIFLVIADTFARVVFAPSEIPIGVVTGLVGAPILLVMIRAMKTHR
ncbi:FecCD family ABC transporter permease [Austwickia chelonae]|uniref:FecCD family ABC transporter permease n=1 Tax=Austwickia chelonae TaxID=100225 RepID=UPI001F079062|nr:iron ABC transporter permease [Austwickia chelonae]